MAWDGSRPVPWKRILKPFAIYAAVAAVLLIVINRKIDPAIFVGLIGGGLVYAALAGVLVKFGWNPPAFLSKHDRAQAAEEQAARRAEKAARKGEKVPSSRPAPPPTKRTNAGNPRARTKR